MSELQEPSFFIAGGTLPIDTPSYVVRQADSALYTGLERSEFCYVLTSRQMGKSSLMGRTAVRLREAGITVVILDLTVIGHNLTEEQWYYSLTLQHRKRRAPITFKDLEIYLSLFLHHRDPFDRIFIA